MTSNDRVPAELDCANLAQQWPTWKRTFLMYMMASGKNHEPEPKKIATFLWLIGPRAMEIYNTLFPNDGTTDGILGNQNVIINMGNQNENAENRDNAAAQQQAAIRTLDQILIAFDQYCIPQKNATMESFKFNTVVQKEKQSFADFETELRKQIQFCEFNCACGVSYQERMLKDRIIIGVYDKKLQLKLLDGNNTTLQKVIETCKAFEAANANKVLLDKNTVQQVHNITTQMGEINAVTRRCYNCGDDFTPSHLRVCKANGATCRACGKQGHYQRFCKQSKGKRVDNKKAADNYGQQKPGNNNQGKSLHSVYWGDETGIFYEICDGNKYRLSNFKHIYRISSNKTGHNERWTKEYQVGNQIIKFKLDTGSDVNCIPINLINKLEIQLNRNKKFENFPIFDYNGNKVKIFGVIKLICCDLTRKSEHCSQFFIVDDDHEPLLGLETCIEFNLIKRMDVGTITCFPLGEKQFLQDNGDVFGGIGKFPGYFSIKLKENSKPTLHYRKRIPLSLLDKLKFELDNMVREGIVSPIRYPTEWVNNLQIVEKPNGKLRICLDPKPLNKCIQREHFLIPTFDDFTSKLVGKRVFSVLDLSSGFWHMELDRDSADLTAFMTPFGRYRFNRVPFGINCAPEMFQCRMVGIFGDIPGVMIYFDDVCIAAESEAQHDRIMTMVLGRARENGVKFNPDKIQYRKSQIKFMGHIVSERKIQPENKHLDAILKMKRPENKRDVMRLLGLFKYLAKFIPNLSRLTANLRMLTHDKVEFKFTAEHEKEVDNLFRIITSGPVLATYDPNKPVTIQTDASKDGLGSVLLQEGHPVAFASRTLSESEQRWAQIEKELLAIVFACTKFHNFVYGREFTVESDHRPLETLNTRDIDDVTPRLQRMFMSLLKYPKMTIMYKPGKNMLIADCLSRAQLGENREIENLMGIIHSVTRSACLSKANYELYCSALKRDAQYFKVVKFVEDGWPRYHQLDEIGQIFHKYKSELHFENGLLFRNHRLVIPTELQGKIAKWLHAPHLGIEKTLARGRAHYFWPRMNGQIREIVTSCTVCEKFTRNIRKEELMQGDMPEYPFHTVSMDLFEYAGQDFLSVYDYYSGFLIVEHLNSKTSGHIISKLKVNFDKMGYPTVLRCDNSPFGSKEFEKFADTHNVVMTFSSPRYAQSNGLAEKGVAIAKNILKRCYEANETKHYQYRILEYNTTPVASMGLAPVQLFFGRMVKTRMPITNTLLKRGSINEDTVQNKISEKRERQKYYYDRNAKSLPVLSLGDLVIFKKSGKEWNYGTIVGHVNNRSYIIRDSFNNFFRRNRRFIAKTKNADFNASDMMFEENIKSDVQNPDSLKEIQIVPRANTNNNNNFKDKSNLAHTNQNTNCNVEESALPVLDNYTDELSDEYETAGSDESEAEVLNTPETSEINQEQNVDNERYRTRSGRAVGPPRRYGWD